MIQYLHWDDVGCSADVLLYREYVVSEKGLFSLELCL